MIVQGRSQDFLKGEVTLCQSEGTHQIVISFHHLLSVVCLKMAYKSGHPRVPLYAHVVDDVGRVCSIFCLLILFFFWGCFVLHVITAHLKMNIDAIKYN